MRSLKIIHGALMMGVTLFLPVTAWVHRVSLVAALAGLAILLALRPSRYLE